MQKLPSTKIKAYRMSSVQVSVPMDGAERLEIDLPRKDKLYRVKMWLLKRLGARNTALHEGAVIDEIDLRDVAELIASQGAIIDRIVKQRPAIILIGNSQMRDLKMRMVYGAFSFPADYGSRKDIPAQDKLYAGMRVVTVPWIDGVVVVPDITRDEEPQITSDSVSEVSEF